ncbi:MAG TPA: RHS repeat-associated core domain-containing protein [Terriglobales bacterium]|nr:RHS repeat-associated core domain-containing protein [Terriglobales bacterium]
MDSAQTSVTTQTSWQYVTATNVAPTGTVSVQLGLPNANPSGAGVCEFDNVSGRSDFTTDLGIKYSARGEILEMYQSTPHSGGYYHPTATYWANGALNTLWISQIPAITFGVDGMGRVSTVSATSGQNPVTGTVYDLSQYKTTVNYGSLDSDVFTSDPNTGRMTQYKFNVGSNSLTGDLTWNGNGSLKQLAITDTIPLTSDTQTCTHTHDDLARIATVNCTNGATNKWNQNFTYDPFGNITKAVPGGGTGISFSPTYDLSKNWITSLPGITPVTDANGRMTYDGTHNYSWDAESKMTAVDSTTVTYDALGRMVEKNVSGTYTQIVYGPFGGKFTVMSGQTLQKAWIPLPGGGTAIYTLSGLTYYRHSDHLGSSRLASTPSRGMYSSASYAPYGEPYAQAGTTDLSFTGQDQDTTSGMHDFLDRKYNPVQGRWLSPDPIGLAAVNPSSPQSWNRYAYVVNNPLALVDPFGDETYQGCGSGFTQGCGSNLAFLGMAADPFTLMFINYETYDVYDKKSGTESTVKEYDLQLAFLFDGNPSPNSPFITPPPPPKPNPCSAFNLQDYNRIGSDGLTIRAHIESQHMNFMVNGGNLGHATHDPLTGKTNSQYMLDFKGTADYNFGVVAMLNTMTIAAGNWKPSGNGYLYTNTFSTAEMMFAPGSAWNPSVLGLARGPSLFGITLMVPTNTNAVYLNKSCQVVTSYPYPG